MKKQIQVLQILFGGGTLNGIASYLYQQYKFIDRDRVKYDFFFVRENNLESVKDDPIFESSIMYALKENAEGGKSINYLGIIKGLRKYLKTKKYDVIVVNSSNVELGLACMIASFGTAGNSVIVHAHNEGLFVRNKSSRRNRLKKLIGLVDGLSKFIIRKKSAYLFGCSEIAGAATFGEKVLSQRNFMVIRNAIDIRKFTPNKDIRNELRTGMGIGEDTFVIGNVGSLIPRKNCEFLIKVFREINKQIEDSVLWIVGDGTERERLEELTRELSIDDKVRFWGARTDVNLIMQGMDAFVFTSKSEGFGIVAIEAQAAGLCTTVSSGVPDDVLITELSQKISLDESAEVWADKIISQNKRAGKRKDMSAEVAGMGYDIVRETANMADFYCNNFENGK